MSDQDFSSEFEAPITILEDLIALAIEEVGNGGRRTLSVLLPALRYVHDLKAINQHLMQTQAAPPKS